MPKFLGKLLIILPLQLPFSVALELKGYEVGSVTWCLLIFIAAFSINSGIDMIRATDDG